MATEAEIIPEPIAVGKTEEESRHLTNALCDKAVEFLPGDLKKFQGGFNQPAETDECLAKEENMQVASDTMNTVSEGNPEVSKGESFLISPETAKVASKETSGMSERSDVDDIPFKAEKIPEGEKQKAGTGENEVKAAEDIVEKYDTDHDILNLEGTSLKAEKLEELNLAIGGEKTVEEVVVIADQGSSLEEKCGSIDDETSYSQERENEGTRAHENDDIESNKQVLSVPEANLELKKQASIDMPDPVIDSLKKVNETVTEASNSNLVQEKLEEKSCKEVKDTEPEKLPALVKKEKGVEGIEPIEISGTEKDQIISESIGGNLTSTVAESSEIKDHETTSEISEGVKKELPNTYEEVACEHKAAPEGDDKLGEVSGTIIKDQSQVTIESSEEIKYITGDNDSIQDKNMLDTASVMKPEELCLQDVDNRDICSIGSNIRTENIVEKSPTEESGQSEINEITDKDSGTSIDISKDYSNSESEKVGADMKVVQATEKELAMTEASDEMKKDEECTVPAPEGNISEVENINVVQQSQEGKLEKEEILKGSFQKQNEPEKERSACPLNAVYEDVNTAISSEIAETSTSIKEVTPVKDHEERFEGDGMEDTPTNTDAISENGESKEKDHLQIEVNVNTESVEVEIPNKNADDLHVADPLVGESVEKEDNNQYEFSDIQPEEQVHEENGASEEKDKHIRDVSEACQSRKSTISENIFTEEATTADLESETSEMDKEKVKEVYLWDPEKCSETKEALENKQEGIQEEEEACNAEKPEIETRGDIAESGLTGGGTSDTVITSSFVKDETTPELTGENKSYKEEDADERSNTKEEDHDEPKIIKIGDDNDEQTVKDDPKLPSPILIEEETIESSKDEENKVEKLEEENSKDWITEDGKSKDLSPDSITEAPIQNLQDDEERAEEFEKSEKAVGESTGDETSQPAESPQEMLNISMMKQEEDLQCEDKNLNPTKAFPEEKRDEDRSYVIQAEESSRNIEQDEAKESNEKKPSIAEEDFEQISTENEPQEMLEKSLHITSEETETISSKADEIPSLMEEATVQNKEETTENEEKVKGETYDSSTNDNGIEKEDHGLDDGTSDAFKNTGSIVLETETKVDEMEVETITKGYELDSEEKPEPKDAVENIEDSLKQKETEEVFEGPKSTIKEECAVIDDSLASTEEEMTKSFQKDEQEETPELEVSKESGTAASGTGSENSDMEEQRIADISNSSISDETVKESIREDESSPMKLTKEVSDSNIEETDSTEETSLQILKETAEPIDDPSLFDILKESKEEITPTEIKEDLVCSSSFEPEESKKDTEEETSVKGSINTVDLDSALPAAETEETDMKEAEAEEKKHAINKVLAVERNSLATTEHEGVGIDSADIDVKPVDSSISCEKDKEIPKEEEDKVPNEGSENQMEMTAREIPLKEILGDALKDYSTVPSEEHEHEPEAIEERKLTDETSEKDQAPYEHSEAPVSEAMDEKLMQMENNPTFDAPKVESEDNGKGNGHEVKENLPEEPYVHIEEETGKCNTVSEATDISKGEEPREPENQRDACESKTSQNEQSSDFGLERKETDDGKPLDEATNLYETSGTCEDGEKAIQEEENLAENLAKPESLKEDIEVEKEETELLQISCDQMPEIIGTNDTAKNVELALAGSEEKPKSDSEPVAEDQTKETCPKTSKSQADETTTDVQNQEAENQIKEEEEDKLEDEDYINREQNANEVSKAVILSEEVDKEVEKAVDSEGSKEHVEEESSTNELHPVAKGDETTNEVEDYSSVSTECLKEADSEEQIEAHSTKDREASLIREESEERGQDKESRDPVSVHGEERESEEKIKEDVTDESKLCQDGSNSEAVTEVRGETSLNKTEVDEELLSTVKEESAIIDDSPKSTEEEMYKSFQKDEKEETPEVEVCEKLETNNTVEDAEKRILEEEATNKDQPTQLTEMMEDNAVAIMSIKEVCKQSETAASGTSREKSDIEEHPIAGISNSSINDETVKESIREDESSPMKLTKEASASNIEETDSTEETTLQILKETAEPNNDPILFDILKESNEEITPTEIQEDLVCSSSFDPEESKKNTEEETSAEGSINTVDLDSALPAAETEETDMKEAEAEEKKHDIDNVLAVEKNGLETTDHEGVGTDSADIDVKPADSSISCEKHKEIRQEEEDKVPNEGSEDQKEMTAREIPLKEILGDALKDYSTVPSEEHEPEAIEERKLTDETSEKDQAPYEHSEAPVSEAMDEKLMQMENNPTLDAPKVESEDNGKGNGHEVKENLPEEPYVHIEEETGKCNTVSEATDISKGEEPREPENQCDACESKTSQNEQSSDFGLERKETDDGKPLDEATNLEETSGTCEDGEKAIQEEENLAENLAKSESLMEDIAVEKEETEHLRRAHDQMPEADSVNDNAKNVELALAGFEEKPKSDSEPVAEDQSKETFPESSKSQADETTTDVQNPETEKQINEEVEDKLEHEEYINREQNANEASKTVILSEEVDKEVDKADDNKDIKEHVMEEESSTNELHPVPKGDETTNEVEDYSSVSTECLKEADSEEQIEAKHPEVEAHSTKDRETSLIVEESEEKGQDEESRDPVSVHGAERESEEGIEEDIADESILCQDENDSEAVTKVRGETSLNNTEVDEELVNTSNASSGKMSLQTTESDANQETKEVENVQLEEISSGLATQIPSNDNDEVQKQGINVDIVDKDEAEVNERDSDAVHMSKDQIDEAEKSLTVEKVDQLPSSDQKLVETKSETSKTSNAGEPGRTELASDGNHVSEDKGTEEDAETKKSLTAEEQDENEVEETKGVPETSSDCISQRVETIVEDEIISHNTLPKEKPEEQLQTSVSTLPSEDEENSTAHPIEKIGEEIQTDAEIVKHKTLEDSSDTKTKEEVCLQKEEQREPSAVSEEETIVDQGLQKEEPKEQIQTTSSTLPSEERGHGTGAISEEKEYDKAKEEVPIELDVFSGDESEQNLLANKPEEGTASSEFLPKEQEEEAISTVEKIEEEKRKEAEIPENKISEDSSDAKKTIEMCLEKEEFHELEDAKKDDSTAHPIEKIEEEIQKDAEIVKHETLEDSSDTKTTEEVCLQKEEQREPSIVSEEETFVDQGLQKEEPEEQIQNKSSTLPSEEREHGTGAISEEIEYDKTKEEVHTELDVISGDKSEQNLSANKSEEGTTSSELLPKEQKEEVISRVEKIEDEKIKEAEIPENKILEDSSDAKKTIEMCLEKEEFQELEDAKKDETAAAQALQVEEPKEQSLTSSSTLPSEDLEHGNTTRVDEIEEEKVKEVATLEKERPQEPEAVLDQEITVAQVSITEESLEIETMSTIQNLDEEKSKEAEKLNEKSGDSLAVETEEICLQKEEPSELQVFSKEEITSGQTFSEEQSDEQLYISTSAITSEELEHETKKAEDEKTNEEEIIKDESPEYASDARTTEEVCSQKERSIELEAVVEDEKTADHTLTEKILEEQVQNPTPALPSKEEECGSTSTTEKIGSEKTEEAEFLQDDNGEHECLRKEQLQEDEAIAKDDSASAHTIPTEKSEEQISGPFAALPSKEHKHETVNKVDKPEEEKVKEEEMQNEDSDEAKTVQEICSKKDETRDPQAVLEGETVTTQVIAEESQEHGTLSEEKKIKEAETLEDDKSPQSECARELQSALEDEDTAAQTLPGEKQADQLHVTTSTLPSEEQEDETREPELQEDESPEKAPEQTREIEEASNVKMETHEKAYDNELLTETEGAAIEEKLVKARDETRDEENQCETTNEGNEIILNEVSKEQIIEDKEVIETSHSTSLSEGLTKDSCGVDELKDEPVEDKTNEAFKTTTCQNEKLVVEAQKSSENEIIEKQTVCEDKTVEDPGQASVARIETATVMEEESSIELAQAEGTKDLAEGNEIIDDIQQPEETANIASDQQIPRVFYPIKITEITGPIGKEDVPIDLQDRVAESSQKAEGGDVKEIYPKVEEVEHGGDKTTDNLGEEITKDSTSVEDLTKASTSDPVESSTKKTLQVTAQDMIEEREKKDETGATHILVDKPEKESPAPSSKFPCEEEEHGVTTKVDAVKEEELKEVETPDNDSSDTNTGGEICYEKEEIKELRAVMEQETVAVQAPPTELKDKELAETPVSKLEDVHKEDELKEGDIRDKTKETLMAPAYAIQNEELSMETKTDSAKNNFEKEIVAEDKTVKDLEQASVGMEEATTAREEIRGEADPVESTRTTSSIGKDHFPIEQQDRALETSEKAEVGDLETGSAQEICSEAGVDREAEKKTDNSVVGITQEPASPDSPKLSLSDLLQRSTREQMQVAKDVIPKRELIVSKEEPKEEEAEAIQLKEAKTDEEKDEGEEGDEHNKADSGSDAPVMVEAPRDTDIKPHKKSHNILSGVGSKVKHSIFKVKKAITGKSSHSKDPKPISPKGSGK
ncbi:hypothetical protein SCA6_017725 [Theobroma cacao]